MITDGLESSGPDLAVLCYIVYSVRNLCCTFLFVLFFFWDSFILATAIGTLFIHLFQQKKKKAKKDIETGAQALEERIDGIYPLTHFESQAGSLNLRLDLSISGWISQSVCFTLHWWVLKYSVLQPQQTGYQQTPCIVLSEPLRDWPETSLLSEKSPTKCF